MCEDVLVVEVSDDVKDEVSESVRSERRHGENEITEAGICRDCGVDGVNPLT